ncbi:MAG TPA: hypothetical protein VGG40_06075 [Solirubrobacterales bacterium]
MAIHQTMPKVMKPAASSSHWPFSAVIVAGATIRTTQRPAP